MVIRLDAMPSPMGTHAISIIPASSYIGPVMKISSLFTTTLLAAAIGFPSLANAWWNPDFKHRTQVVLNTTAQGVETKEALSGAVVPCLLYTSPSPRDVEESRMPSSA